jgi:hypothetical protein
MLRKALAGGVESGESLLPRIPVKPPLEQLLHRFGHYELVTGEDGKPVELGRGAMGVTYKAFDVDLHRPVTLKVNSERHLGDESARLRFLREARAAARLRHSNVASVLHLGESQGWGATEQLWNAFHNCAVAPQHSTPTRGCPISGSSETPTLSRSTATTFRPRMCRQCFKCRQRHTFNRVRRTGPSFDVALRVSPTTTHSDNPSDLRGRYDARSLLGARKGTEYCGSHWSDHRCD